MPEIAITDTLRLISGANPPFPALTCNSLLVVDEQKALIDSTAGEGLRPLSPGGVDLLICSHVHADHINYNWLFPDAPLWVPAGDAAQLRDRQLHYRETGWTLMSQETADELASYYHWTEQEVAAEYEDGHVFDCGQTRLTALRTPGHWPNHMVFWEESARFLYTTDIDLVRWGPFYGNASADIDDFIASVERLIALEPRIVATSHLGEVVTENVEERFRDYLAVIDQRDEVILGLIRGGKTLQEVLDLRPFYRRFHPPEKVFFLFQWMMTEKHLTRLVRQGRARVRAGRYYPV